MAPDATPPMTPAASLDGRDISRVRTEVRLAHLALLGLLGEEDEFGGTPERVMVLLAGACPDLQQAVDKLGAALAALNEDA